MGDAGADPERGPAAAETARLEGTDPVDGVLGDRGGWQGPRRRFLDGGAVAYPVCGEPSDLAHRLVSIFWLTS